MSIALNLSSNAIFGVPGGYPFRLLSAGQTFAIGVIPRGALSVSANVYADKQADVHLALFSMPSTVSGPDGSIIVDTDSIGLVTKTYQTDILGLLSTSQTITVTCPTTKAPACYVVKLWVDNIQGTVADTLDRNADGVISTEPAIPLGVNVTKVYVA